MLPKNMPQSRRIALLVLGCLVLSSGTVLASSKTAGSEQPETVEAVAKLEASDSSANNATSLPGRSRAGRLFSSSSYGNQAQPSMDSYAAAYSAAASSQNSADGVQDSLQSANDVAGYASFGESGPAVGSSPGSSRQAAAEYGPQSGYYSSYMSPSSSASSYASAAGYSPAYHNYPHYRRTSAGYPTNYDRQAASSYYDNSYMPGFSPSMFGSGAMGSGGLMSSASTALSHWTSGFSVGEIICALVAISIGAIILGAPFFLIYLALMGNFSGSGTLSLTNPTGGAPIGGAATTVNGRRKRLAVFEQLTGSSSLKRNSEFGKIAETVISTISPYIDIYQVSSTFKKLLDSIERYSPKPETKRRKKTAQA